MKTYWHFIPKDRTISVGTERVVISPNMTVTVDGDPILCKWGLHASYQAIHALKYAPGPMVCKVKLGGKIVEGKDKSAATERTVLAMADATHELHRFGLWCIEDALKFLPGIYRDPRSETARVIKRLWLDGQATNEELVNAMFAASDAADIAHEIVFTDPDIPAAIPHIATAMRNVASPDPIIAAYDTAWSVANAIVIDARNRTTWRETRERQNAELEKRLSELLLRSLVKPGAIISPFLSLEILSYIKKGEND